MEHPPKQGLKQVAFLCSIQGIWVLMEHPPKQGLKLGGSYFNFVIPFAVLMEHPPKQGLKRFLRTPGVKL